MCVSFFYCEIYFKWYHFNPLTNNISNLLCFMALILNKINFQKHILDAFTNFQNPKWSNLWPRWPFVSAIKFIPTLIVKMWYLFKRIAILPDDDYSIIGKWIHILFQVFWDHKSISCKILQWQFFGDIWSIWNHYFQEKSNEQGTSQAQP